jgi:hypothetical protein
MPTSRFTLKSVSEPHPHSQIRSIISPTKTPTRTSMFIASPTLTGSQPHPHDVVYHDERSRAENSSSPVDKERNESFMNLRQQIIIASKLNRLFVNEKKCRFSY